MINTTMKLIKTTPLTVALLYSATASAHTVDFSNITGSWFNGTPVANVTYRNNGTATPSADWGGVNPPSGYDFSAVSSVSATVPPSPSPDFSLGTFTHRNQPIPAGTSITSIQLEVDANISVDLATSIPLSFIFNFAHNETPNSDNPCADGGANGVGVNINGCADNVQLSYNNLSESFLVGTDLYTLNIIGFLQGDTPVNSYWTVEGQNNSADLIAQVALRSDVVPAPEPSSIALLSIGLLGLTGLRQQRWVRRQMLKPTAAPA